MKIVVTLVMFCSLLALGCSDDSREKREGIRTLVMVYDFLLGKFTLEKQRISSLKDTRVLDTYVAQFHYKTGSNILLEYEDPIQLNLVKMSSDFYMPEDVQSLNAVSSYKIYDSLYSYHQKLGILHLSSWPKKVAIESKDAEFVADNAFHVPEENSTYYLPFKKEFVPGHLNPGVIAHEENHGLFYQQVFNENLSQSAYHCSFNLLKDINAQSSHQCQEVFLSEQTNVEILGFNHAIFRSLDEGLADFSGYIFTNLPDYLNASIDFEASRTFNRVISNQLVAGKFPNPDSVEQSINDIIQRKISPVLEVHDVLGRNKNLIGFSYSMAGQISSMLNILSESVILPEDLKHLGQQEYLFKLVSNKLSELGQEVKRNFLQKKISYEDIFNILFDAEVVNKEMCLVFETTMSLGKIPIACNNLESSI